MKYSIYYILWKQYVLAMGRNELLIFLNHYSSIDSVLMKGSPITEVKNMEKNADFNVQHLFPEI